MNTGKAKIDHPTDVISSVGGFEVYLITMTSEASPAIDGVMG